jgi:hypothetical protein
VNIVMLNFCYDVPVKLYSAHLLLMSLFLLLPDLGALCDLLVRHRPAELSGVWLPPWERTWLRVASIGLQVLVICGVLYSTFWGSLQFARERAREKPSPIAGAWEVGLITSPAPDQSTWQQFLFENQNAFIRRARRPPLFFRTQYGDQSSEVKLSNPQTKFQLQFGYRRNGKDTLVLSQASGSVIELHRAKPFLLTTRGFHWISEYPYNR